MAMKTVTVHPDLSWAQRRKAATQPWPEKLRLQTLSVLPAELSHTRWAANREIDKRETMRKCKIEAKFSSNLFSVSSHSFLAWWKAWQAVKLLQHIASLMMNQTGSIFQAGASAVQGFHGVPDQHWIDTKTNPAGSKLQCRFVRLLDLGTLSGAVHIHDSSPSWEVAGSKTEDSPWTSLSTIISKLHLYYWFFTKLTMLHPVLDCGRANRAAKVREGVSPGQVLASPVTSPVSQGSARKQATCHNMMLSSTVPALDDRKKLSKNWLRSEKLQRYVHIR